MMQIQLRARSLDVPANAHPNRLPFSGVLTKIDEPSDAAPEGSNGNRVTLTMDSIPQRYVIVSY
jgi:hypothetical protein